LVVPDHAGRGLGSASPSGGDLTSLIFGDLIPHGAFYRAVVELETVIGLATFTLALTYVLSAFDALGNLHSLYARVQRNAIEPHRPSTIIERRYRQGSESYLQRFPPVGGRGTGGLAASVDDGAFARVRQEATRAVGIDETEAGEALQQRFHEWSDFHRSTRAALEALAGVLGYPELRRVAAQGGGT
jgi:hypothetical protein